MGVVGASSAAGLADSVEEIVAVGAAGAGGGRGGGVGETVWVLLVALSVHQKEARVAACASTPTQSSAVGDLADVAVEGEGRGAGETPI